MASEVADFVTKKGLKVSTKLCLHPHQEVLWSGKIFTLVRGEIRNTYKMPRKCLAIVVKRVCSLISPKGGGNTHRQDALGIWTMHTGDPVPSKMAQISIGPTGLSTAAEQQP